MSLWDINMPKHSLQLPQHMKKEWHINAVKIENAHSGFSLFFSSCILHLIPL